MIRLLKLKNVIQDRSPSWITCPSKVVVVPGGKRSTPWPIDTPRPWPYSWITLTPSHPTSDFVPEIRPESLEENSKPLSQILTRVLKFQTLPLLFSSPLPGWVLCHKVQGVRFFPTRPRSYSSKGRLRPSKRLSVRDSTKVVVGNNDVEGVLYRGLL